MPNLNKKIWNISSNENSLLDYVSFMCLRTNPKLTTNVKLVTNGDDIWLDSYSATSELSESRYKSQKLTGNGLYNNDISKFYKGLDKNIPYAVFQEFDDTSIKTNFGEQYETTYWCGAEYINSLEYEEELGIVAPLWLDKKLPDYFVVFKIDEPSYVKLKSDGKQKIPELNFKNDILKKCTLIKTFDLTEKTKFGNYLRRYASQSEFPQDPLKVSFKKGIESVYNGISIENGCFVGTPEYNYSEYFEKDQTITDFDKYITLGFERNGIVCANLLNIEFLFNDNIAKDYTFGRYFGLYCNYIEDDSFSLDFENFKNIAKTGNIYDGYIDNNTKFSKKEVYIENDNGVVLPFLYDKNGQNDMFPYKNIVNELNSVFCVKDKTGNFHNLSRHSQEVQENLKTVTFCEKKQNIMDFTGFVTNNEFINAKKEKDGVNATIVLNIKSGIPIHTKLSFFVGQPSQNNTNKLLCDVYSEYSIHEENDILVQGYEPCWYTNNRFYGDGTPNQIAYAVANAINVSSPDYLESFSYKNKVVVVSKGKNETGNNIYLKVEHPEPAYMPYILDILGIDAREDSGFYYFKGGSAFSHLVVSEKYIDHFKEGDYLATNTKKGFGKITAITLNLSNIEKGIDNRTFSKNDELFYNISIDENDVKLFKNSQVLIYKEFIPTFGRLSFFPVKDFDLSTYENPSIYGDLGEIENEYVVIKKESKDDETSQGSEETGENITKTLPFTFKIGSDTINTEILFENNYNVIYNNDVSVTNLEDDYYEVEFSLRVSNDNYENTTHIVGKNNFKFETLSTLMFGNKMDISNEYDMFLENYSKEHMLVSKTVPFINKWTYHENSLDVREKPYRLNTSMAFGINSFSPNPYNIEPESSDFNQEWAYILDEYPFNYETSYKSWSYLDATLKNISESTGENLEDLLKSTTKNYFDILFVQDFMSVEDNENEKTYDHLDYKRKYSLFEKGSQTTNSETFFRGAKIEVLQKVNYGEAINNNLNNILVTKNNSLNGYKFSVVIVPYKRNYEGNQYDSKKTKIIRNDVFKFIVVIIYIAKEIYCAVEKITTGKTTKCVKYDKTTRYLLYDPENGLEGTSNNNRPSVFGNGHIINITSVDNNSNEYNIYGENTNFLTDFNDTPYNRFVILNNFDKYISNNTDASNVYLSGFSVVSIKSDNHLVATKNNYYGGLDENTGFTVADLYGNLLDGRYIILEKSKNALAFELKKASFGNVFYNINYFQPQNIEYEHVLVKNNEKIVYKSKDGEYTYAIKILPPELNAKYCFTKMSSDNQYIYYNTYPNYAIQISRQSGYYTPLFKDILYFKDPYVEYVLNDQNSDKAKYLKKVRYCNTEFAVDYFGFGYTQTLNFHRANDVNNNVFDLTDSQKPLLPIQNKFSIGKRKINVFNSNWDPWYYTQTDSAIQETEIHGTSSMVEHKAFLGSKYLKVPDKLVFDTFEYEVMPNENNLNNEIIIEETQAYVSFEIDMEKRLMRCFKDTLNDLFKNYIDATYSYGDKTTINDDIELYIKRNILPLYEIGKIEIYEKSISSGTKTSCDFTPVKLNNLDKIKKGLSINTNASITSSSDNQFKKLIRKTLRSGYAYWFGLSITIRKK